MRNLEAKIQTVNKVNEIKNYLFPLLKTVLQDFVGCKVTKVNHALLKDVESLLVPIVELARTEFKSEPGTYAELAQMNPPMNPKIHIVINLRSNCQYSISMWISVSVYFDNISECTQEDLSIGGVRDHLLTSIYNFENLRTDFTVDEIQKQIQTIDKKAEEYADEKNKLDHHFQDTLRYRRF